MSAVFKASPVFSMRQDSLLPPDDPLRQTLHNEVHARPSASLKLPVVVHYVAVLNEGVARADEHAHLCRLPGQEALPPEALGANFLRLNFEGFSVKWERHTEFTRYSVVQALPEGLDATPESLDALPPAVTADWLRDVPGRTFAALKLVLLEQHLGSPGKVVADARSWFDDSPIVASVMGAVQGPGHSVVVTDFQLRPTGWEHIVVIAEHATSETRAGRIAQRLLEIETYRLMALRALPVAKALGPLLGRVEAGLASITERLHQRDTSADALLDELIALAARVEHLTAEHQYRFNATEAYHALVQNRINELHEGKSGAAQTLGEFMQRRLSPAMATVALTAQRLTDLSRRIERASALLRTRVDIATDLRSQALLTQLSEGQSTQLRMQATVEGLSIAAITYYVVSLLLYVFKALKLQGWWPLSPELSAGIAIPLVLAGVWWTTRRIHRRFFGHGPAA